jgi:voltage-gated potassium channel
MIDQLTRPATHREEAAQRLEDRLDPYMILAAIAWLLAWTLEPLAPNRGSAIAFDAVEALIWIFFGVEFVTRVVIAESTLGYLKKHWWEVAILALPGLRFLRILRLFRVARAGSGVVYVMAASRSAENKLASRITTLIVLSTIVILASGRLLFDFGHINNYLHALHDATLAAIGGQPIATASGVAEMLEVFLIAYHAIVVAALAGMLGAFFLTKRETHGGALESEVPVDQSPSAS